LGKKAQAEAQAALHLKSAGESDPLTLTLSRGEREPKHGRRCMESFLSLRALRERNKVRGSDERRSIDFLCKAINRSKVS